MIARDILNLSNKLRKRDKMRDLPSISLFFFFLLFTFYSELHLYNICITI